MKKETVYKIIIALIILGVFILILLLDINTEESIKRCINNGVDPNVCEELR